MGINVRIDEDWRGKRVPVLFNQYPGQTGPQPVYVALDEDGDVWADWDGEIGNAVPMSVWHGRTLRWALSPYTSGQQLVDLLTDAEVVSLLETVHLGHSIEWDGSNNVGCLTEAAEEARDRLEELFDRAEPGGSAWTVDEWCADADLSYLMPPGASIAEAAQALVDDAAAEGVLVIGCCDAVEEYLAERIAAEADED